MGHLDIGLRTLLADTLENHLDVCELAVVDAEMAVRLVVGDAAKY